jgi:hypothetical protein
MSDILTAIATENSTQEKFGWTRETRERMGEQKEMDMKIGNSFGAGAAGTRAGARDKTI